MKAIRPRRSGYALMLVLIFNLLFLAMLGVSYRRLGAAMRVEAMRMAQVQRDEGSIHALARGLTLLETGSPPSSPYVCAVSISTSSGSLSYTVTFTAEGNNKWSVQSVPTVADTNPQSMPVTFSP